MRNLENLKYFRLQHSLFKSSTHFQCYSTTIAYYDYYVALAFCLLYIFLHPTRAFGLIRFCASKFNPFSNAVSLSSNKNILHLKQSHSTLSCCWSNSKIETKTTSKMAGKKRKINCNDAKRNWIRPFVDHGHGHWTWCIDNIYWRQTHTE